MHIIYYIWHRITHATPASFYGHVLIRNWENLIAHQLGHINQNETIIDIAFGGGLGHFIANTSNYSFRNDGWDLTHSKEYSRLGWNSLLKKKEELFDKEKISLPCMGLFSYGHIPAAIDRHHDPTHLINVPSLLNMSEIAIDALSEKYKEEGYIIMIEASHIDSCEHANDIGCMIHEMIEAEETLKYLHTYVNTHKDTLLINLADHETGGLTLGRNIPIQGNHIIPFDTGTAPSKHYDTNPNTETQYYSDSQYNLLIPPPKDMLVSSNIGYSSMYDWRPHIIQRIKHSCRYIINTLILKYNPNHDAFYNSHNIQTQNNTININVTLNQIIQEIEYGLGIEYGGLNSYEIALINNSLHMDSHFGYELNLSDNNMYYTHYAKSMMLHVCTLITSIRTYTGWTTHGHTGADIPISAHGPYSDMFVGTFNNWEIGNMLSDIMNLTMIQNRVTSRLRNEYINDPSFIICDRTQRLHSFKYQQNVSYPKGNLRSGYCVESYK